jgi:hypothetical protein
MTQTIVTVREAREIELTFPMPEEEIPAALEVVMVELRACGEEMRQLQAMYQSIRQQCSHTEREDVSHTGKPFVRCTVCGMEW